jgi:hypothetical protein
MIQTLKNFSFVAIAAASHVIPVFSFGVLSMHASTYVEAMASSAILLSSFLCGYLHGENKTFKS